MGGEGFLNGDASLYYNKAAVDELTASRPPGSTSRLQGRPKPKTHFDNCSAFLESKTREGNGLPKLFLQPEAARNNDSVEQVERPLHKQRENGRRNGALQDCRVIV